MMVGGRRLTNGPAAAVNHGADGDALAVEKRVDTRGVDAAVGCFAARASHVVLVIVAQDKVVDVAMAEEGIEPTWNALGG